MLATHLDYAVIARWTPRQLEAVTRVSQKQVESIESGAGKATSAATTTSSSKRRGHAPMGIDLDKYPCWKPTAREAEMQAAGLDANTDPFSVSREQVKERWYVLLYEAGKQGGLEKDGVRKAELDRGDLTSLRNLFDRTWADHDVLWQKRAAEWEKINGIRPEAGAARGHAGS